MTIRNSVGFIQTSNNRYIILLDKNTNKWMFPGGMVDSSDTGLFRAFAREYEEETGYRLPLLKNIYRNIGSRDINYFEYKGHTRIYYAKISTPTVNYHETNETNAIAYATEEDIISLANKKKFKFIHSFLCYINLIKR
jgi:8-oxo-dGTP pyrophosphatase MutT (NUDIX family)